VPTDRIQRINAAVMAVKELGYSKEQALDEIGVTDPAEQLEQHYIELLLDAHFQNIIQKQAAEIQAQIQFRPRRRP
jgi:hypothetical protein